MERALNGICVREMKFPSVPTSMAITETWKVRVGENVLLLPPVHRRRTRNGAVTMGNTTAAPPKVYPELPRAQQLRSSLGLYPEG